MDPITIAFVVDACAGRLIRGAGSGLIRRVGSDSRQVQLGDLFVAIPGERFDGHQFLSEAASRGAAALLVQTGRWIKPDADCAIIEVDDVRLALGLLGARYRRGLDLRSVAVVGSNGKTTTKELIASVLRQRFSTIWSEASFNNELGVPFTLLRLNRSHQAAVLELGTNHPGELAPLIQMAQPKFGVITSIGREHLEFFGDLAGVAEEEGTLAARLPQDGVLVLDGDSEWAPALARRAVCRVVKVGWSDGNQWRLGEVVLSSGGTQFRVTEAPPGFAGGYAVGLLGRHQALNALFAVVVGAELGLDADEIRRGLNECRAPKSRLMLCQHHGISILDDSYNANADSMITALKTLSELPCTGRRVAVIGDMAELGTHTRAAQIESGQRVGALGVDLLVAVGRNADATLEGARGHAGLETHGFARVEEALEFLNAHLEKGDLVLVKASRSARLDRITEGLLKHSTA